MKYDLKWTSTLSPLCIIFLLLVGCSSPSGRYQQAHDSTPTRLPTEAELKDAVPRVESHSRGGNKHYTVRGKHYNVLSTAVGFKEQGIASWYGNKFHGHLTSNGEIYNMYAMSAAHKNLPLPSYVKVTNLANDKTVIVRVNDRGPFHPSRVIDLSYSAAYKLDMLKSGTANVEIEAITDPVAYAKSIAQPPQKIALKKQPALNSSVENSLPPSDQYYIQVFATKDQQKATQKALFLASWLDKPVIAPNLDGVYRVQIGPFKTAQDLSPVLDKVKASGYPNAFRRKILQ